jgi:hypothetical protein
LFLATELSRSLDVEPTYAVSGSPCFPNFVCLFCYATGVSRRLLYSIAAAGLGLAVGVAISLFCTLAASILRHVLLRSL